MFDHIGARYFPGLIFRHTFNPKKIPNGVDVRFTFTKPLPDAPILPRAKVNPQLIDSKTVVYRLESGQDFLELDYRLFPDGLHYRIDRYEAVPIP